MGEITRTADQVIEQLGKSRGNISHAAGVLNTSRKTLHKYINEHSTVEAALKDIRETGIDNAETMLQARMQHSDTLLIFFLKTQGKKRGYTELREIGGPEGGAIPIEANVNHAIDGDTAETIFGILAAAGALTSASGDAETE